MDSPPRPNVLGAATELAYEFSVEPLTEASESVPAPAPMVLYRHDTQSGPGFELRLADVPRQHSWRWQVLGRLSCITQPRLDAAIATLQARSRAWMQLISDGRAEDPHAVRLIHHVVVGRGRAPAQPWLSTSDLATWTCNSGAIRLAHGLTESR